MHSSSAAETLWTTVNVSEALPGVATPMGWSVWGPALDGGVRGTFAAFGVLTPHEAAGPHGEHDRLISIFYGRAAPALRPKTACLRRSVQVVSGFRDAEQVRSYQRTRG